MSKKITFSNEARNKLTEGVNKLANAVTSTLGPSGRNVIIEQEMGNPTSTKDGVTVAKSIQLKDKVENLGAQIVKQAAIKTALRSDPHCWVETVGRARVSEQLSKVVSGPVRYFSDFIGPSLFFDLVSFYTRFNSLYDHF